MQCLEPIKIETYIGLGGRELKLDQTNLGLLDSGGATGRLDDVLGEDKTINQLGIIDGTSDLLHNANILQINVDGSGRFNDPQNSIDGNGSEQSRVLRNNLGVERGAGTLKEGLAIGKIQLCGDLGQELVGLVGSLLEGFCDGGGVDALVQHLLSSSEQRSCQNNDRGSTISSLNILSSRQIDQLCK